MIVVFGDINVDIVMRVESLPKRSETLNGEDYLLLPGGKGANQAVAAALVDAPVAMFGRVGNDSFASSAITFLRKSGVNLTGIKKSTRPTGCATVWVEQGGENSIIVAAGANHEASADQVPNRLLKPSTIILMQMHVTLEENWKLARRAKAKGCQIFLNVAPAGPVPQEILELVDVLIVNELEGSAIAEQQQISVVEPADIPRKISSKFKNSCILTLGAMGAIAFNPSGGLSVSSLPITPLDTVGAGDAFVGALAAAIHRGDNLSTAIHYASVGAGICCTKSGAQPGLPDSAMINSHLDNLDHPITINHRPR